MRIRLWIGISVSIVLAAGALGYVRFRVERSHRFKLGYYEVDFAQ